MSESSQHVLNNYLDLTGYHTEDESIEIEKVEAEIKSMNLYAVSSR